MVTGMKRFICVVYIVVLLLSACSVSEQKATELEQTANDTYGIYELTFKTEEISNDGVGNDWSFTYTYNGKTIQSGYKMRLSLEVFTFRSVQVEVREDDKLDDTGTGTLLFAICDGGSGKTQVTVTENGGRYKGSTAVWEITCTVNLVGKQ